MAAPTPTLLFAGGAGTVTGSRHLVRARGLNLLLDCGLFQGLKPLRLRNWEPPPFEARALDAVLLSHAHLDHCGYLPVMVRRGFTGPIYCTAATADLTAIVLRDAARLGEEDAERANRRRYTRHRPALPLFTSDDAERAISLLAARPRGAAFALLGGAAATFREAGHILGSATTTLDLDGGHSAPPGLLGRPGPLGAANPARPGAGHRGRRPPGGVNLRRSGPRQRPGRPARPRHRGDRPPRRRDHRSGLRDRPGAGAALGPARAGRCAADPAGLDPPRQPDGHRGQRRLRPTPGGARRRDGRRARGRPLAARAAARRAWRGRATSRAPSSITRAR